MKIMMRRMLGIVLILAVALSSVIGGKRLVTINGVPEMARAAGTDEATAGGGQYIRDMVISYADSKEKAEAEFGAGYTVINADLNEGNSGHTWLGYRLTDNPDLAIRDIKAMDMYGGFSTSDYEELLKEHEKEFDEQMDSIIPAVCEFAKNYDGGVPAATGMIGYLNRFYENDSEKGMGDYLLDAGRALNQNASDSAVLADMKKVFMQGNSEIIETIERILMQTQGNNLKKEGSWLSRMSDMGPNGLKAIYKKVLYPKKSSKAIDGLLKKEFDDDANMLLKQMPIVRELLGGINYSEIRKALENEDTEAFEKLVAGKVVPESGAEVDEAMSVDESMDSLTETIESSGIAVDNAQTLIDAMVTLRLMAAPYGDSTLFDFFMREDLQAEDLYPMAYLLSAGQKSLLDDVGIHSVFWSIMAGDAEDVDEETDLSQDVQVSVYDGCDRGEFEGDTAVTSEALKRTSTSGKSLFMDSATYNVILVSSALASIGAFVYAAKMKPKLTGEALEFKVDRFVMAEQEKLEETVKALADKYNRITEDCMNTKMKYLLENDMVTESKLWPTEARARYAHFDMQLKMRDLNAYNKLYAEDGLFTELDKKGQKVYEEYKAKKLEYKNFDEKVVRQKGYNKLSKGAKVPKGVARAFGIVCGVVAVGLAAYEIYCMTKKENTEYTEIPGKIIDRSYPEGSEEITFINYYAVLTPEKEKADIHQKKADRWVSLYTSTDEEAGEPILASTLTTNAASTQSNADMIPVTTFGESSAYKISDGGSAYMFFGRNENALVNATEDVEETAASADSGIDDTEASVFGNPTLWIIIVLGVLVVIAAGSGIYFRKKRSRETDKSDREE